MSPAQKFEKHGVPLILMEQFRTRHGTTEEKVKMILIGENGMPGVSPFLGIEVEADDQIGADHPVDQASAITDLPDTVKQSLSLRFKTLLRGRDALLLK